MGVGDITSSATNYKTMALLEAALEELSTGAATAGADTTTFMIIPDSLSSSFWLISIARAGS